MRVGRETGRALWGVHRMGDFRNPSDLWVWRSPRLNPFAVHQNEEGPVRFRTDPFSCSHASANVVRIGVRNALLRGASGAHKFTGGYAAFRCFVRSSRIATDARDKAICRGLDIQLTQLAGLLFTTS